MGVYQSEVINALDTMRYLARTVALWVLRRPYIRRRYSRSADYRHYSGDSVALREDLKWHFPRYFLFSRLYWHVWRRMESLPDAGTCWLRHLRSTWLRRCSGICTSGSLPSSHLIPSLGRTNPPALFYWFKTVLMRVKPYTRTAVNT